ncbi:unnamed protein product [Agarophyton chilense]|eukprot:gb/GEZJ01004614.1/.p1 GENE.gb/GEZJ01004614.1/~~gb/GEZJ01004614.1/.p1  ORF type:complete len:471 (+),score=33.90 gb/GEZJ01004614.1/:606-2018(+)
MDPHMHRSEVFSTHGMRSSLVCVGGMLRVADPSHGELIATPLTSRDKKNVTPSTPNVTPFKVLASPFTATAPFTAPTTPCSSCPITPIRQHHSTTSKAMIPLQNNSLAPTPALTPELTCSDQFTRAKPITTGSHMESLKNSLTPKQVRELRRLCRKTANRAEFEDRRIQIRQVASISAMASSSVHLFDPDNPCSGKNLRSWVQNHRANGVEWRDERPLSDTAIEELRRWDRLLKAWAHIRFEKHCVPETVTTQLRTPSAAGAKCTGNFDSALRPVRLQFEQHAVLMSPTRLKYDSLTGIGGRNVDVDDVLPRACGSPEHSSRVSDKLVTGPSNWDKSLCPYFHGSPNRTRAMAEVSIRKIGGLISVTVPTSSTASQSAMTLCDEADENDTRSFEREQDLEEDVRSRIVPRYSDTCSTTRDGIKRRSGKTCHSAKGVASKAQMKMLGGASVNISGMEFIDKPQLDWSRLRR